MGDFEIRRIFQPVANGAVGADMGRPDQRQGEGKIQIEEYPRGDQYQRPDCRMGGIIDDDAGSFAGNEGNKREIGGKEEGSK